MAIYVCRSYYLILKYFRGDLDMKTCVKLPAFFIIIVTLLSINSVKAQWIQTSGATGSNIECFTVKNSDIYAGYNVGINSGTFSK